MLFLHGSADDVVSPRNALRMNELLTAEGVVSEAMIYEGIDHIEIIVATALLGKAPVVEDVDAFFSGNGAR
jgi:fermentation-respiration switch protein FrsA (DUF1100 family)